METFVVKINRVRKTDENKFILVLDVFLNDTKVGKSEVDYSIFQGIMVGKFQECAYETHLEKIISMSKISVIPQN